MKLVVLVSGSGTNLQALINATTAGTLPVTIEGVISDREGAYGLIRAEKAGIKTQIIPYAHFKTSETPRESFCSALVKTVNAFEPELVVLAGFMRILTEEFLSVVACPVINLHPALPGEYPGTHALERAWSDYEVGKISRTGIMVHRVILALDAGEPIVTEEIVLKGLPDFQALRAVSRDVEHRILVEAVRKLSQGSTSLE